MPTRRSRKPPSNRTTTRPTLTPKQRRDVTEIREQVVMTGAHLDNAESGYREMISGKTHGDRQAGAARLREGIQGAKSNNREALRVVRGLDERLAGKEKAG